MYCMCVPKHLRTSQTYYCALSRHPRLIIPWVTLEWLNASCPFKINYVSLTQKYNLWLNISCPFKMNTVEIGFALSSWVHMKGPSTSDFSQFRPLRRRGKYHLRGPGKPFYVSLTQRVFKFLRRKCLNVGTLIYPFYSLRCGQKRQYLPNWTAEVDCLWNKTGLCGVSPLDFFFHSDGGVFKEAGG